MGAGKGKPLPPGVQPRVAADGTVTYRARWRDKRGNRHSLTFDTPNAASDHLAEMRREKRLGRSGDPTGGTMLFGDWFRKWDAGRSNRGSTELRDESHFGYRILPEWADVRLADIEVEDINVWVAEMLRDGDLPKISPATAAKHLTLLGQCLDGAIQAGRLAANPVENANHPKVVKKEARFLTLDELVALEMATVERERPVMAFMADVGTRIGEASAVRVSDLDLLNLSVKIRETATYERGGRTNGPTKTAKGFRLVPFLSEETAEALAELIFVRKLERTDFLFKGKRGGQLDPKNWRNRVFRPAVEAAGLGEPLPTPHALRHTAVSRWIAAGNIDLKRLADAAGHESMASFSDRYGHLLPYDAKPTRDALSEQKRAARERAAKLGQDGNVVPLGGASAEGEAGAV